MIDFTAVSREIRSVVSRRRGLLTFLGSVFAATSIFMQNVLYGELPTTMKGLEQRAFAAYGVLLLVPSLILALRLAKLNAGLVLNGLLFIRLMAEQGFTKQAMFPSRSPGPNVFGVSFQMFLLADLLAGFAAALVALSLGVDLPGAVVIGAVTVLTWVLLYLYYHYRATAFALKKGASDPCAPFDREQWEAHQAGSLEDANHDMITVLALVGLIVFAAFQGMSGLGKLAATPEIAREAILNYGPTTYATMMTVTSLMGLIAYLRLRIAVGHRSLEIDPTDRPFRPLRLTDSLLGYMLLAFLFALSLHMLLLGRMEEPLLFIVDGVAFAAAVFVEQVTVVIAGRQVAQP